MNTFIARCQGNRGEAHRLGHKEIHASIATWKTSCNLDGRKLDDGTYIFSLYVITDDSSKTVWRMHMDEEGKIIDNSDGE